MMHIVIATGLYPPEIGGPATFAVFFEKGLAARGISHTTIPFARTRRFPKIIRHAAYFWSVFRALRSDSIVLALDPVSVGFPALLAARLRRTPFYLRVGGDYAWEQAIQRWEFEGLPEEFPGSAKLPLAGRLLVWAERYVARHAKRILTQSGHLASMVARWDIPRERVAVIQNGVALPELPSREKARAARGFGDEPVIVSAARLVPWKGFRALIDAFLRLKETHPSARLLIAGEGPEREPLEAYAAEKNVPVEFIGTLSREALFSLLRASDAFVLNTRYEGFSHQILEALAVGVPTVTTDIPSNKELAVDGETALVVPWNDVQALTRAIRRILEDKTLARRLAEGGQERAKRFTPERTFIETLHALDLQ